MAHDDTMQTKLDKLDAMLAQTSTSKQDATLVAEMLSLPNDGRYPALELEPQQRRQKTLEALTAHVETLSRQNPLLMTFEDVHWTDPSSIVFGVVGAKEGAMSSTISTYVTWVCRARRMIILISTIRPAP